MAAQGGISGPAVGMATAGAFLLYIGIQGVGIRDGLKAIAGGKLPVGTPHSSGAIAAATSNPAPGADGTSAGAGAGGGHPKLVAAAKRYLGVPYKWGGTSSSGLDCSGLVVRAFQDAYDVTPPRTTYVQVTWSRLESVSGDPLPGDLLFWPKVGPPSHVGIAVSATDVIHAPRPGKVVEIVPIRQAFTGGAAPLVKRYKGADS